MDAHARVYSSEKIVLDLIDSNARFVGVRYNL